MYKGVELMQKTLQIVIKTEEQKEVEDLMSFLESITQNDKRELFAFLSGVKFCSGLMKTNNVEK